MNPTTVVKPAVTRISKSALFIVIGVIAGILILMVLSLDQPKKKTIEETPNDAVSNTQDQAWINHQSNAVVLKPLDNVITKEDSPLEKIKQEEYIKAISAPLTPSGDTQEIENVQQPEPALRKLPLSQTQIEKLSQEFGNDQNMQSEKSAFVSNTNKDYLEEKLKNPVSPFEVQAGSIIPAITGAGINSDLPGQLTARVRQNVYDSVTGKYLLIPQGSKLLIVYDSNVAFGQERVLPAVKRVIFPNGQSMNLEGMPASDSEGYAGFKDQINNHYGRIYGAAMIMGGLAAAFQLSQPAQQTNTINSSQIAAGAMGQQLAQVTTNTVSKNLNIQPNLIIRKSYKFNVNITSDLIFQHPYSGDNA